MVKKSLPINTGDAKYVNSIPGSEDLLEEEMQPTLIFLPGDSHGQRSLAGGHQESDTIGRLSKHLVISTTDIAWPWHPSSFPSTCVQGMGIHFLLLLGRRPEEERDQEQPTQNQGLSVFQGLLVRRA